MDLHDRYSPLNKLKVIDAKTFGFSSTVQRRIRNDPTRWINVLDLKLSIQGAANAVYFGKTTFHLQACVVYEDPGDLTNVWSKAEWERYTDLLEFNRSVLGEPPPPPLKRPRTNTQNMSATMAPCLEWEKSRWMLNWGTEYVFSAELLNIKIPIATFIFDPVWIIITPQHDVIFLDDSEKDDKFQDSHVKADILKIHDYDKQAHMQLGNTKFMFNFKIQNKDSSFHNESPVTTFTCNESVFMCKFTVEASTRPEGPLWSPGPARRS